MAEWQQHIHRQIRRRTIYNRVCWVIILFVLVGFAAFSYVQTAQTQTELPAATDGRGREAKREAIIDGDGDAVFGGDVTPDTIKADNDGFIITSGTGSIEICATNATDFVILMD